MIQDLRTPSASLAMNWNFNSLIEFLDFFFHLLSFFFIDLFLWGLGEDQNLISEVYIKFLITSIDLSVGKEPQGEDPLERLEFDFWGILIEGIEFCQELP